jgi:hypothetical protein
MKNRITPLHHLIKELKSVESHVTTTDNVIHMAESLLQLERDNLAEIGNLYVDYLKNLGIKIQSGEETVNRIYGKL